MFQANMFVPIADPKWETSGDGIHRMKLGANLLLELDATPAIYPTASLVEWPWKAVLYKIRIMDAPHDVDALRQKAFELMQANVERDGETLTKIAAAMDCIKIKSRGDTKA